MRGLSTNGWPEGKRTTLRALPPMQAPLLAGGNSLGASVLVRYVGERGGDCVLAGAACMCPVWNFNAETWAYQLWKRTMLLSPLQAYVLRNRQKLGEDERVDVEAALKARTVAQFDAAMHCGVEGYAAVEDFYEAAAPTHLAHRITTPTLCLQAADDPIVTLQSLRQIKQWGSGLVVAVTGGGGHNAYYEEYGDEMEDDHAVGYSDRVAVDWFIACIKFRNERVTAIRRKDR